MNKLLLISPGILFTYYGYKILVIYIPILLFQSNLQENVVKVISRYAVSSVTVYTIWRRFLDTEFRLVILCIRPLQKQVKTNTR